jgi:hypothetical protein
MGITGAFTAAAATRQPMAGQPPPNPRHGQMTQPRNNWSAPPASTGGGYPDAQAVTPQMDARGLVMDLGHRWGHHGPPANAAARVPFTVNRDSGQRVDGSWRAMNAAQEASALAHSDTSAGYYQGHMYAPMPAQFAGSSYEVREQSAMVAPGTGVRTGMHGRLGGGFTDGDGSGEFRPTGFNLGERGRFAVARYSSPTLGAMYSKNSLRGVLPQVVQVPVDQPAIVGDAGQNSGIPPNRRFLAPSFTMPQLFRSPPSVSDRMIAAGPEMPEIGPVGGVFGF